MTEEEFFESQERFKNLSSIDQLARIAWYFHDVRGQDRVDTAIINRFYRDLHLSPPQTSVYLPRMAERKLLLRDRRGYYLEGRARKSLDDLLKASPTTVAIN